MAYLIDQILALAFLPIQLVLNVLWAILGIFGL